MKRCLFALAASVSLIAVADVPWRQPNRREALEEPDGVYAAVMGGPRVGGMSVGSGTWLSGTWILGDYEASTYWQDRERAFYGSLGMTLRLMPRWRLAPFAGAGAAYHQSLSGETEELEEGKWILRGASHWSFLGEAGLRLERESGYVELCARYARLDVDDPDADHLYGRLAWGRRWK